MYKNHLALNNPQWLICHKSVNSSGWFLLYDETYVKGCSLLWLLWVRNFFNDIFFC